jgi:hypothetical protein
MPTPRHKNLEELDRTYYTPSTVPIATEDPPAAAEHPARKATHDAIARRAYELFEQRGSEPGREWEDWFQAEREL